MFRCPARSDFLVSLESGSESNPKPATFVPQEPALRAIVEQIAGLCVLTKGSGRARIVGRGHGAVASGKPFEALDCGSWKTDMARCLVDSVRVVV